MEWWNELNTLNKVFFGLAAFFSVFFIWQLFSAILGLTSGGADIDTAGHDVTGTDAADHVDAGTLDVFRLLSFRSVIAFGTLFSWAGALYLQQGYPFGQAIAYSLLWGLGGGIIVGVLIIQISKLQETGNSNVSTCVGVEGDVYMTIPEKGMGKVRVPMNGIISFVKARSVSGESLAPGARIRVTRCVDSTTVEVEKLK
ncbi:MAG: hypothetical protein WC712_06545 [Candidatus Brocadiia bacterium]